jgi:nucleoid-associated protein YgaU
VGEYVSIQEAAMNVIYARRLKAALAFAITLTTWGCTGGNSGSVEKGPIPPGEYVVVDEEDDLSHISLRAYGDMKYWYSLLNANPELTKRPGFDLIVGESITVPARADIDMSLPKSIFPEQLPADYIIMPGDSLPFIAQGCYGDRDEWMRIYEANRHVLSERVKQNPRDVIAGEVLHIPALSAESQATAGNAPIDQASTRR